MEREQARIIPWVFHKEGSKIGDYRKAWKNACDAAHLPGKLFHALRRTAVRNLERADMPRSVAMKLTGHKVDSVSRRSAIVPERDLREGVSKLAEPGQSRKHRNCARFAGGSWPTTRRLGPFPPKIPLQTESAKSFLSRGGKMVRPQGIEPRTNGLRIHCSTGLSYGREDKNGHFLTSRCCAVNEEIVHRHNGAGSLRWGERVDRGTLSVNSRDNLSGR